MTRSQRLYDLYFIAVISAVILAYELILTRILAVHYWSYFASMIVSLAMLGFAASGTALFLMSGRKRGTQALIPWMAMLFTIAVPVCPWLSEMIQCSPLVILWNPRQLALFAAEYLILSMPFFFGGFIIGHFFMRGTIRAGRVYFANMLGSGSGILIALFMLSSMPPSIALLLTAVPAVIATFLRMRGIAPRHVLLPIMLAVIIPTAFQPALPSLSEYKGMSHIMLMPDADIEYSTWNRFGYISLVESRTIRYAPGLSLNYTGIIPKQKAIFTNGDDMEAVCESGDPAAMRKFYDSMLSGLMYRFHEQPRLLIAGAGGGMDVLSACVHEASGIDAIEHNKAIARLMTGPLSQFAGGPYSHPKTHLIVASARAYISSTTNRYDLALVPAKRSMFASAAGTSAHDPDFMLTREALDDFFSVLAPGGILAMETWLNLPPRHSARLFATAAEALTARGLDPAQHLMAARSLRTSLLLVFRDPIAPQHSAAMRQFCRERSFDVIYYPGISHNEANIFNIAEGAVYYTLSKDILSDPESAYQRHLFQIRPPSDDRPYFSHFFKWAALPQLFSKMGTNTAIYVGWGYMFLLITLAQAIVLGTILILLPLSLSRMKGICERRQRWRVYSYFSALGLGFMFLELAAIQQFARFLPHPVYAFGLTVGIILLMSGTGALAAGRRAISSRIIFLSILVLTPLHILLWQLSIHLRSNAIFSLDIAAVALLAFFMGMPFPQGIERLRIYYPGLIPWAWGINGFVSVLAVLLAGLVSLSWGLSATVALTMLWYTAAFLTFPTK